MARSTLRTLALAAVLALAGIGSVIGAGRGAAGLVGPLDTIEVGDAERAAGPRYGPAVAAGDRAWIEAAIAASRPEAMPLIAEVDGLVEFRTHVGPPLGVTRSEISGGGASAVISLDVSQLNGRRVIDREVTVLHELGHAIDFMIVEQALNDRLEAGIPRTGTCSVDGQGLSGSCTEPAERFADTFAKWALNGRVSALGAGYGVANPSSLDAWGAPLGILGIELAHGR